MLQGYRTYLAAALMAIFSGLAMYDWNIFMADPKAGALGLFVSIVMMVMRALTTTPAGTVVPPISSFMSKPKAPLLPMPVKPARKVAKKKVVLPKKKMK